MYPAPPRNEGKPRKIDNNGNEGVEFTMRTRISCSSRCLVVHLINGAGTCASETANVVPVLLPPLLSALFLDLATPSCGSTRLACMGMDGSTLQGS